jgi:hypothetical protein
MGVGVAGQELADPSGDGADLGVEQVKLVGE